MYFGIILQLTENVTDEFLKTAVLGPNKVSLKSLTFVFLISSLLHFGRTRFRDLHGVLAVRVKQHLLQRPWSALGIGGGIARSPGAKLILTVIWRRQQMVSGRCLKQNTMRKSEKHCGAGGSRSVRKHRRCFCSRRMCQSTFTALPRYPWIPQCSHWSPENKTKNVLKIDPYRKVGVLRGKMRVQRGYYMHFHQCPPEDAVHTNKNIATSPIN